MPPVGFEFIGIKVIQYRIDQDTSSTVEDCLFVCFPGVTTHCGCIFTAR